MILVGQYQEEQAQSQGIGQCLACYYMSFEYPDVSSWCVVMFDLFRGQRQRRGSELEQGGVVVVVVVELQQSDSRSRHKDCGVRAKESKNEQSAIYVGSR